jgi:NodT family efflux transporter outer membrane factor (OMF) lipoprotein
MANGYLLIIAMLLFGCLKVGENYKKPELNIKNKWNAEDSSIKVSDEKLPLKWWQNFNDTQLSLLAEKSLSYNHDIKISEARIKEAVANHNAAFASLFPQISGAGSLKREQLGAASGRGIEESSNIGVRGAWDLDIFGGNKRRKEAAEATLESTQAHNDRVKLSIVAEVARNYIKLCQFKKQKQLVIENIKIQQNTLDGVNEKRKVGEATDLEVTRAEAQVEDTKIRLTQLDTDIAIVLNRLNVLTGEDVDVIAGFVSEKLELPDIKEDIVVSTPIQVVATHPDIRAAERELASRTALTGAAFAEMFPKLSLEGFFGSAESALFGAATPWNVAGNLFMPILNFGALRAQVKAADARQEQAFEQYQQTVLLTLENAHNTFTSYKNEKIRAKQLESTLEKRKKIVEISKEKYNAGSVTQLDLLLAQENQLDAENNLAISQSNVSQSAVALYESLGVLN